MGGLFGSLFDAFDWIGRNFFTFLIGAKRGQRPQLRTSRVVAGGSLSCAAIGVTLSLILKPQMPSDDAPAWALLGALGAIVGIMVAGVLLAYVSAIEREERDELREKKRREDLIAKGIDP